MEMSAASATPSQTAACQALVYNLLQRCGTGQSGSGAALALVSAHPRAGVTHIQRLLEHMLNENEAGCAVGLDCSMLGCQTEHDLPASDRRGDRVGLIPRTKVARYRDRVGHLNALKDIYRYVLLDCHSLKEKTDVLGLAPIVDGTIVVVECNRTTRGQLDHLERSIERYGGTIVGSVMNKTTYAIPQWINGWMERAGF